MKIILLCSSDSNQKALACKIHDIKRIEQVILYRSENKKNLSLLSLVNSFIKKTNTLITGLTYRRAWFGMLNHYKKKFPNFPIPPLFEFSDINHHKVVEYISKSKPDLVIVSGTNLLRKPLIEEILKYGKIMNLHTGLSPYIKGGPNCTNWCLALRRFGFIGNTIMWLNSGIDSGNIIISDTTTLTGKESLSELHIKVMDHGHEMYINAIERFVEGNNLPNISQEEFGEKRLFLSKHWTLLQMIKGLINFYLFYKPGSKYFSVPKEVRLIKLYSS